MGNPSEHSHYWCQLCLFVKLLTLLWMCHLPLSQLAVLPPPSVASLTLRLCSGRGHDHGHASQHGTGGGGQGAGGGFGTHCEPQAVLQDPGKHPIGGRRSWLRVCFISRCTRSCIRASSWSSCGAPKQHRALVLQMCNKMWK